MDHRQLQLIVALLLVAGLCHAGVYKWTDAQGHVHFGDQAATTGTGGATAVDSKPGPVNDREELELTIEEHGRPLPDGIRARAETSIHRVMRVYRHVFGLDLRHTVVVSVHVFDTEAELQQWMEGITHRPAPHLLGVYLPAQHLVGVQNIEDQPEETLRTLVHEANHVILAQMSPNAPVWLHEGLSQYFEGIDTATDRLLVQPDLRNDAAIHALIARGQLIQAHTYLAIPDNRWQELAHQEENPLPYVIALSLTSFLMSQPLKRQMLGSMLQDLEKAHIAPDLDTFVRRYPGGLTMLEYDWYKWAMRPAVAQTLD